MPKDFVVTFVARDRPGLVDIMSEVITDHGGNWLESRMAHLAEKFAGIVRVQAPDDQAEAMADALAALSDHGFRVTVEEARTAEPFASGAVLTMEILGPDQPGIVHEISHCLAQYKVSVEELETSLEDAPFAGGKLFRANLTLQLPTGLSEETLADALEEIGSAVMVDVTFGEAN
ncbi:glycine cleavage system protein R [Hwanghaeella sp.]|uniref:glycine cleavage system protein R n=1 Tax=Hwanghaeella sp. TaxID=2605943 RepID=UPI003CCBF263